MQETLFEQHIENDQAEILHLQLIVENEKHVLHIKLKDQDTPIQLLVDNVYFPLQIEEATQEIFQHKFILSKVINHCINEMNKALQQNRPNKHRCHQTTLLYMDKLLGRKDLGEQHLPHIFQFLNEMDTMEEQIITHSLLYRIKSEFVTADQEHLGGEPRIAGTRIPISLIIGCLGDGMTVQEICEEYDLSDEQVQGAINWTIKVLKNEKE